MGWIVDILERKRRIQVELKRVLTRSSLLKASTDYHARRRPRPCGITVHPATGCVYDCVYCYVSDMGFREFKVYPLEGLELTLALALNPYIAPGPTGSLAAFGSVTEPLAKPVKPRTLEYLRAVASSLKLPCQISTKEYVSREDALLLRRCEPNLSVLVTIVSLEEAGRFEPGVPSPEARLESIGNLTSENVHTALFVRPVIPGVTDREAYRVISEAVDLGARGVVVGTLRVAPGILGRLRSVGYPTETLRYRGDLRPGVQVPVVSKAKSRVLEAARLLGVKVYPSACSANVESHGQGCVACRFGPCGDESRIPLISPSEVEDFLEYLGLKFRDVVLTDGCIRVSGLRRVKPGLSWVRFFLEAVCRRRIYLS